MTNFVTLKGEASSGTLYTCPTGKIAKLLLPPQNYVTCGQFNYNYAKLKLNNVAILYASYNGISADYAPVDWSAFMQAGDVITVACYDGNDKAYYSIIIIEETI